MHCRHEGALTAQRWACGELEALGIPWRAEGCCPDCGGSVRLDWRAGRCAVWERRAAGFVFRRQVAAPAAEERPLDAGTGPDAGAADDGQPDSGHVVGAPVLVVEDDPDTRELLQTVLAEAGVAVAAVASGGAARSWLGRRRPALLLLDELLPDARGQDVARAARRRYGPALPILVVSAARHPWTGAMANVVALPKPFDLGDLLRLVRALRRPVPLPPVRCAAEGDRSPGAAPAPWTIPDLSPSQQPAGRTRGQPPPAQPAQAAP